MAAPTVARDRTPPQPAEPPRHQPPALRNSRIAAGSPAFPSAAACRGCPARPAVLQNACPNPPSQPGPADTKARAEVRQAGQRATRDQVPGPIWLRTTPQAGRLPGSDRARTGPRDRRVPYWRTPAPRSERERIVHHFHVDAMEIAGRRATRVSPHEADHRPAPNSGASPKRKEPVRLQRRDNRRWSSKQAQVRTGTK